MKRYSLIIAAALILTLVCAGATLAVFPNPDGVVLVELQQGWYNNKPAWFFCTATSDIKLSFDAYRFLTPKLTSALVGAEPAARPYYIVTNFNNFPVFSTKPGNADYSGIWQLFTVTWKPGFARPITNSEPASPTNPTGLPAAGEADIAATGIVDHCPVVAIGPLGGPWNCVPHDGYRIPQGNTRIGGMQLLPQPRMITLPIWLVNCQDPCTMLPQTTVVVITDVSNPYLAASLGANFAPGLLNVPEEDTTTFWDMAHPKPPSQLPILRDCPDVDISYNSTNSNFAYSSVMRYVVLLRFVQPWVNITTVQQVLFYLDNGKLQVVGSPEVRLGGEVFLVPWFR